jgi:VWFA-related protein
MDHLKDTLSMTRRMFLAGVLAACAASVIASDLDQAPQFRAAVDLVYLDVSVLDNERRPVRGLTADDFQVFEDGKPQAVSTFAAVDIPDTVESTVPWMREVPPDTRRNDTLNDRRLFVMVIDDATAQANVAALRTTKLIAKRFIDNLGPTDLMAIVFTLNNTHAQDYTSDRARLLAAVDKFNIGFRNMGDAPSSGFGPSIVGDDTLFFRYSIETLGKVSELLASLPQQRKALVYVGQGVPLDPVEASNVLMAVEGSTPEGGARQAQLLQRLRETFRRAQRANVTFYTLDTCGLRVRPMAPPPPTHTCVPGLEVDYLRGLAVETGGYSTADTNDFGPGITQIFRENASYYLLGFQPTNRSADGKFRRIEVKVKREGMEVRTRAGYVAEKPPNPSDKKAAKGEPEPLSLAISGLLPKKDVPMQAWAAPFPMAGNAGAAVPIALALRLNMPAREERVSETIDLRVDAYAPGGKLKTSHTLRTQVTFRPGPEGQGLYEVLTMVRLPPGTYQLRMAASLARLRTSGSVYVDVDVPDSSKGELTWSGIAFRVFPSVPIAQSPALQTGLPIVPTSNRLFARTDEVTAFARIHQGGKGPLATVRVTASLMDSNGNEVKKQTHTMAPDQFGTMRGADVGLTVPVGALAPGPYRFRLEATVGRTTVVRDARFTVR